MYYFSLIIIGLFIICVVLKIIQKLTTGRCKSPTCLIGKTALVTGGNSGIGYETALGLAARGCRVIIADINNCDKSKESIILKTGNNNIITKQFNLASLSSIRNLAEDINNTEERLDILINNAGAAALGHKHTTDGLHPLMQTNHFGPFLLTHLLIDLLKKSAPSRIIFVSSVMAYVGGLSLSKNNLNFSSNLPASPLTEASVYSHSKICNVITSNVLAKRLHGTGVTSNSLFPGIVYTPIYNNYYKCKGSLPPILVYLLHTGLKYIVALFSKTPEEGAQTSLYLALDKSLEKETGKYFGDCIRCKMPPGARSFEFANEIWNASEEYVKLLPSERI